MKERESQLAKSSRVSLEGLAEQIRQAGVKDLPLIIKGDVTGSVEVLADSLVRMSTEKVRVKVLHSGVGSITESDVLLATASNTIIIGFNVRPERKAAELAQQENVEIRLHSIIYELQDEIRLAMMGLLEPTFKENYIGRAEVLNIFRIPKVGTIAGCRVQDGVIRRDAEVKVMRGSEQVFKGKIGSLKRFKDDAREVTNGMECGIGVANFSDIKEGDLIEAFSTEKMAADLGAVDVGEGVASAKLVQTQNYVVHPSAISCGRMDTLCSSPVTKAISRRSVFLQMPRTPFHFLVTRWRDNSSLGCSVYGEAKPSAADVRDHRSVDCSACHPGGSAWRECRAGIAAAPGRRHRRGWRVVRVEVDCW